TLAELLHLRRQSLHLPAQKLRLQAQHLCAVFCVHQFLGEIERRGHVLLGIGNGFLRNLGSAALRDLGATLHLTYCLGCGVDEAIKCLPRLCDASFGKYAHLARNNELLEWILGHRTLLLSIPRQPKPRSRAKLPGAPAWWHFQCQLRLSRVLPLSHSGPV